MLRDPGSISTEGLKLQNTSTCFRRWLAVWMMVVFWMRRTDNKGTISNDDYSHFSQLSTMLALILGLIISSLHKFVYVCFLVLWYKYILFKSFDFVSVISPIVSILTTKCTPSRWDTLHFMRNKCVWSSYNHNERYIQWKKSCLLIFLLIALPAFDFCDLPWSVALSVVRDGNNDAQF